MSNPLVSVVVSCYNHAQYIESCLRSVLRQTYDNIQLIVLDDGSTDNSVAVIQPLADQYGFYFKVQENQGISGSFNRGLAVTQGKYVVFFDSDDIMFADRIEKQVRFMEANPSYALCGSNVLKIDAQGALLSQQRMRAAGIGDFSSTFLGTGPSLPAPSMFFRRNMLIEAGGFLSGITTQDVYISLRLTSLGHPLVLMNDVLMYYRVHANNTYKRLAHICEHVLKCYDLYAEHPLYEQARAKYLNSTLAKAARRDKALARKILTLLPVRYYNLKTLKGLLRLVRP